MKTSELNDIAHPFLFDLKPEYLSLLAQMAMPVSFEANEPIFNEGEIANRFYLLLSGSVSVEAKGDHAFSTVIQTLHGGDVLGWSWILPHERWNFSARAVEPCEAIFLYGTQLRDVCEKVPTFGYSILKRISMVLVERLQATRRLLLEEKKQSVGG